MHRTPLGLTERGPLAQHDLPANHGHSQETQAEHIEGFAPFLIPGPFNLRIFRIFDQRVAHEIGDALPGGR